MATSFNTIHLGGDYDREEAYASAAVKPGNLVEFHSSSGNKRVRVHATAKGHAALMVAVEDSLQGKSIDDAFASTGDMVRVPINIYKPGGRAFVYLKPATAYLVGDKLESAGDGTLQKLSGTADLKCIGECEEALDLSASGAVATRCAVRFH